MYHFKNSRLLYSAAVKTPPSKNVRLCFATEPVLLPSYFKKSIFFAYLFLDSVLYAMCVSVADEGQVLPAKICLV